MVHTQFYSFELISNKLLFWQHLRTAPQAPYLSPSMAVILVIAILMGLGDAAFNTQIISLISSQFTSNTSQAYALYKLVQSVGVSAGFAVSTRVGLYWQILGKEWTIS